MDLGAVRSAFPLRSKKEMKKKKKKEMAMHQAQASVQQQQPFGRMPGSGKKLMKGKVMPCPALP